jgi:hypothetical protein
MLFRETVAVYVQTIWNTRIYKNPIRTSQETHYVFATKLNRLMLFRKTVAVYCENHTEHRDTPCWQTAKFSLFSKQVLHVATTGL